MAQRMNKGGIPRPQGVPKGHVLLFRNAQGGPRIVGKKETARLDDPTMDGNNPAFEWHPKHKAQSIIAAYYAERGVSPAIASVAELVHIDKNKIMDYQFFHLESKAGKRPPYDKDPFYRMAELTMRAGERLTDEEYERLDREGWVAKIEVTTLAGDDPVKPHGDGFSQLEIDQISDTIKARVHEKMQRGYEDLPQVLPAHSPEEAKRDKEMLSTILPKIEQGKPLTPGQHRFLLDLIKRYEEAGIELADDIKNLITNEIEVMGQGKSGKWPTLADAQVHGKHDGRGVVSRKETFRLNAILKSAPKFVLSATATTRIAEALAAYPEQVVDNGEFALPPFETCWIEYPNHAMAEPLGFTMSPRADVRTGFLFHNGEVYVSAMNPEMAHPEWTPVIYRLNCNPLQGRLVEEMKRIGGTREELDLFYWGKSMGGVVNDHYRMGLRAQHGFRAMHGVELPPGAWRGLASDVPVILAILLTLNTPSKQIIQYAEQPKRSRQTHRGKVALHAHRIVTIDMDKAPSVRILSMETEHSREKRHIGWHEVRGHFVHDKRYREVERDHSCDHGGQGGDWWCEHAPGKWECLNCGAKRTWRTYPNGRGDRDKPVTHHYVVKG